MSKQNQYAQSTNLYEPIVSSASQRQAKLKMEKDRLIMKLINKTKTKGILAIGEHENKNTVIDTDSDVTIGKKAKGVTKLICSSLTQKVFSTKPISQTREKLSSYLVKTPSKPALNTFQEEEEKNKKKKREFTIIIPGQEHYLQKTSLTKSERRFDRINSEPLLSESPSQSSITTRSNQLFQAQFLSNSKEKSSSNKKGHYDSQLQQPYQISSPFSISGIDIFTSFQDTKVSNSKVQRTLEKYEEKTEEERFASSVYSREVKPSLRSSMGGNVSLLRKIEYYEYIKKYQMHRVISIQRAWRMYFKNSINKHIILIQAFWRKYWLRTFVFCFIKSYYKGWAFIRHITAYCIQYKHKYWWRFLKKLRIMPKLPPQETKRTLTKTTETNSLLRLKPAKDQKMLLKLKELNFDAFSLSRNSLRKSLNVAKEPKEEWEIERKCVNIAIPPSKTKEPSLSQRNKAAVFAIEKTNVCFKNSSSRKEPPSLSQRTKAVLAIEKTNVSIDKVINKKEAHFEKLYNELLVEVEKMKEMLSNPKRFEFVDVEAGNQFELLLKTSYNLPLKPKVKQKETFASSKMKEHKEVEFTYHKIQRDLMLHLATNNSAFLIPQSHCSMFSKEKAQFFKNELLNIKSSYINKKSAEKQITLAINSFKINLLSLQQKKKTKEPVTPHSVMSFDIINPMQAPKKKDALRSMKKPNQPLKTEANAFSLLAKKQEDKSSSYEIELHSFDVIGRKPTIEKKTKEGFAIESSSFGIKKHQMTDVEKRIKKKKLIEKRSKEAIKLQIDQNSFEVTQEKRNDSLLLSASSKHFINSDKVKEEELQETKEEVRPVSYEIKTKQIRKSQEETRIKKHTPTSVAMSTPIVTEKTRFEQTEMAFTSFELVSDTKSSAKGKREVLSTQHTSIELAISPVVIEKPHHELFQIEFTSFELHSNEEALPQLKKALYKKANKGEVVETKDSIPESSEGKSFQTKAKAPSKTTGVILMSHKVYELTIGPIEKQKTYKAYSANSIHLCPIYKPNIYEAISLNSIHLLPFSKPKLYQAISSNSFNLLPISKPKVYEAISSYQINLLPSYKPKIYEAISSNSIHLLPLSKPKIYEVISSNRINLLPLYEPKTSKIYKAISLNSITLLPLQKLKTFTKIISKHNESIAFSLNPLLATKKFSIQTLTIQQVMPKPEPKTIERTKSNKRRKKEKKILIKPCSSIIKEKEKEQSQQEPVEVTSIYKIDTYRIEITSTNKKLQKAIKPELVISQIDLPCFDTFKTAVASKEKKKRTAKDNKPKQEKEISSNVEVIQEDYIVETVLAFDIPLITPTVKDEVKEEVIPIYQSKRFKSKQLAMQTKKSTQQLTPKETIIGEKPSSVNVASKSSNVKADAKAPKIEIALIKNQFTISQMSIELSSPLPQSRSKRHIEYILTSVESFDISKPQQPKETIFSKVLEATKAVQESIQLPIVPHKLLKSFSLEATKDKPTDDRSRSGFVNQFRKKYALTEVDEHLTKEEENEQYQPNQTVPSLNQWNNTSLVFNYSFQVIPKHSFSDEKEEQQQEEAEAKAKGNIKENQGKAQSSKDPQGTSALTESIFTKYVKQRPGSNEHFTIKFLKTQSFSISLQALYEYEELVRKILSNDRWNKISLMRLSSEEQFQIISEYHSSLFQYSGIDEIPYAKKYTPKEKMIKSILALKLKSVLRSNLRKYASTKLFAELNSIKEKDTKRAIIAIRKAKDDKALRNALRKWHMSYIIFRIKEQLVEKRLKDCNSYALVSNDWAYLTGKKKVELKTESCHEMNCLGVKKMGRLEERKESNINCFGTKRTVILEKRNENDLKCLGVKKVHVFEERKETDMNCLGLKKILVLEERKENDMKCLGVKRIGVLERRKENDFKLIKKNVKKQKLRCEIQNSFQFEKALREIEETITQKSHPIDNKQWNEKNEIIRSADISFKTTKLAFYDNPETELASAQESPDRQFSFGMRNDNIISVLKTKMHVESTEAPSLRAGIRLGKQSNLNRDKNEDKENEPLNAPLQEKRLIHLKAIKSIPRYQNNLQLCKAFIKWKYQCIKKGGVNVEMMQYKTLSNSERESQLSINSSVDQMKRGISLIKMKAILYKNSLKDHFRKWKRTNVRTEKRRNTLRISRSNPSNEDINNQMKRMIRTRLERTKISVFSKRVLINCIITLEKNNTDALLLYSLRKWNGRKPPPLSIMRKYSVKTKIRGIFILKKKLKLWRSLCMDKPTPSIQQEEDRNYLVFIDSDPEMQSSKNVIPPKESITDGEEAPRDQVITNTNEISISPSEDAPLYSNIKIKKLKKAKEKGANPDESLSSTSSQKTKKMKLYKKYISTPSAKDPADYGKEDDGESRDKKRMTTLPQLSSEINELLALENEPLEVRKMKIAFNRVITHQVLRQAFYLYAQKALGKFQTQRETIAYTIIIRKIKKSHPLKKLRSFFNKWKALSRILLHSLRCEKLIKVANITSKQKRLIKYSFHKWHEPKISKAIHLMLYHYNRKLLQDKQNESAEGQNKLIINKLAQWKTNAEFTRMKPMVYYSSSPNNKTLRLKFVTQEVNSDTKSVRSERSEDSSCLPKRMFQIKTKNTIVKRLFTKRLLNDPFFKLRSAFFIWRSKYSMIIKWKILPLINKTNMPPCLISVQRRLFDKIERQLAPPTVKEYFLKWKLLSRSRNDRTATDKKAEFKQQTDNASICSSSSKSHSKHSMMSYINNLQRDKAYIAHSRSSSSKKRDYSQFSLFLLFNRVVALKFNALHKELYQYSKTKMLVSLIESSIKHYAMKKLSYCALVEDFPFFQRYSIGTPKSFNFKAIAATFIQYHYRQHRIRLVKGCFFNALSNISKGMESDDKSLRLFIKLRQWRVRAKIMNSTSKKSKKMLRAVLNRLLIQMRYQFFTEFIEVYVESMKLNHLVELVKKMVCSQMFNSMKRNMLLYKFIFKYSASSNYLKEILVWRRKTKLMRRKENALLKILKVIKRSLRLYMLNQALSAN